MRVSKNETDSEEQSMQVVVCSVPGHSAVSTLLAVVCSILYDNNSSFVCRFDDNVAIGLEGTDGTALCLKLDVCADMHNLLGYPLHFEPAVGGVDDSHDVEMPVLDGDRQ
eukprot:g28266.t1